MRTVVGVFQARADAEQALEQLRQAGIEDVNLLTPQASEEEVRSVPTMETERRGMGPAVGAVVGGAMGTAGGVSLGSLAASTAVIPGVGPVIAIGMAVVGAFAGAAAGSSLESAQTAGLPVDEHFVYEDALRQGRSVVMALAEEEEQRDRARTILESAGAESLDAARERWWIGLRSAEREAYMAEGGDFERDEAAYRRGFEAAQRADLRGRSYEQAQNVLARDFGEEAAGECFRKGFERGQGHWWELSKRRDAA